MKDLSSAISIAQTPRGLRISLPPRFWLLMSLRRTVRRIMADERPWTYLAPAAAALRIEQWIAEVEIQIAAERRRRAWSANDAEWEGALPAVAPPPQPPPQAASGPIVIRMPTAATTRGTLRLLEHLQTGQVLVATIAEAGATRTFALSPSGVPVATRVAQRAIAEQLVRPACDGLFGPETSQSWDLPPSTPTEEPVRAVTVPDRRRPSRTRRPRADREDVASPGGA